MNIRSLYLVIKNHETDKSAIMSQKTGVLSVVAWILIVIGAVGFLGAEGEDKVVGIVIALVMVMGGILLLRKASKTKKTAIKYKKYIDIVVNQNVKSIDNVASAVGLPYDVVVKELQNMINIGYLKDSYIHQGNREIILKQQQSAEVAYTQTADAGQTAPQTIAARCPGCGANNVVAVGRVSECEYCGTPINA